jgi:hypothetical protein
VHEAYLLTFASHYFGLTDQLHCRSQWPRGLKRGFATVRLPGLRVRIPPGAWMSVSCGCYVLLGSLCVGLITRRGPAECGDSKYDGEASIVRTPCPTRGCCDIERKNLVP